MKQSSWYLLFFAWVVSLVSTLGSLFFSDIMGFPPCTMCWYQRICMYPLVAILLIGLLRKESLSLLYSIPLVVIGWFWAFYHTLLIFDVIKEEMAPCSIGIPCSTRFIDWFGFIDIPVLALIAFTLIILSSILIFIKEKGEK